MRASSITFVLLSLLTTYAANLRRKPPVLSNLQVERLLRKDQPRDNVTPLFWHIHKAGGTTVQDMVSHCLDLTVASEVGTIRDHGQETSLRVFPLEGSDNRCFVNVDTTSFEGIERAQQLGFVGDKLRMANVIFTGILPNVVDKLYTDDHKAVLFTIVRHPVDRAVSTFYYLQKAHWESSYSPEWQNMTLLEYATNYRAIEENWMVRWLSDKPQLHGQPLDYVDLEKAKTILREQIWVGLIHEMEESMQRFGQLFGWNRPPMDKNGKWDPCVDRWVRGGGSNRNKHRSLTPEDKEYKALAELNKWDMMLYDYAIEIFHQDGKDHFGRMRDDEFSTS